jgi:prepilin-type N-terminal cleavage/methylation domain-containing protein
MGKGRGFTLLEMVVAVAIVAILLALLVPALAHARWSSRLTRCAANLHAIGQAIHTYETDQGARPMANPMPAPFHWPGPLPPLYDVLAAELPRGSAAYRCPDDRGQVYDRCAAVSPGKWGISYIYVRWEQGRLDTRDLMMWDYNGDSAHGLVEPPLHGGKVQNSLYRDGSVSH